MVLPAQAATPDQLVDRLQRERVVQDAAKEYSAMARGAMLYHLCPKEYGVDTQKTAFFTRMFNVVSRYYMDAYAVAHKTVMGKLPGKDVIAAYSQRIAAQQAEVKAKLGETIQRYGCLSNALMRLDGYWNKVRANENDYTKQFTIKKQES
jgi:hypothetical protein